MSDLTHLMRAYDGGLRLPLKGIGDRLLPLSDVYPQAVVFIVGWRTDERTGTRTKVPIGTGFLVSVPTAIEGNFFPYVVTAAHVVRTEAESWVRFNTTDGGLRDTEVPDWTFHPLADVAVARITFTVGLRLKHLPADDMIAQQSEVELGDRVYFAGLLASLTAMGAANVPMVRTGTLGRRFQPDVPLALPDGSVFRITAHLIDCRSYGGFSGSPCFVQYDRARLLLRDFSTLEGSQIRIEHDTALLGLISGHFDDWLKARTKGDILGEVESRMNTGVGIVTPAEMIKETLEMEELVEDRDRRNREYLEADPDSIGTADQIASPPQEGSTEYELTG